MPPIKTTAQKLEKPPIWLQKTAQNHPRPGTKQTSDAAPAMKINPVRRYRRHRRHRRQRKTGHAKPPNAPEPFLPGEKLWQYPVNPSFFVTTAKWKLIKMLIPARTAEGFFHRYAAPNAVFPPMKILSKTAALPAAIRHRRRRCPW